jgi:tetratricopeptide (TPR) repeat protein
MPVLGGSTMKALTRSSCLLFFTCFCVYLPSRAQSSPRDTVTVRELSIPRKAAQAFEQGLQCLAKNDPAGSLPHFQRAIQEYAGYYEAYDRIGAADLKLWRLPDAEEAFRKAIEVSGGQFAHPLLALGAILDQRDKFDEAESVTRKGLALDPQSWTGHYYLALAMFGENRLAEAEQSVREALHWKADFPQAHLLLADIHSREKNYSAVVGDLSEYLKLSPDGPSSAGAKALLQSAERMMLRSEDNSNPATVQP